MINIFEGLQDFTSNLPSLSRGKLSLSIVNTDTNGKRMRFSPMLLEQLGNPEYVRIAMNETETGILVAGDTSGAKLSKGGILYQSKLVQTLTDAFSLDFTSATSHSFSEVEMVEQDGIKYAEIILNNNLGKEADTANGADEHSGN